MLVSVPVRVVGDWNLPEGLINVGFDTDFRRTSVGGVVFNVRLVMKWRSKNKTKIYHRVHSCRGGVVSKGGS